MRRRTLIFVSIVALAAAVPASGQEPTASAPRPAPPSASQPRTTPALPAAPLAGQAPAQNASQAIRDQIDRLRQEFDLMKQDYERRFASLEARLSAVEAGKAAAAAPGAPAPPPGAPPTPTEAAPAQVAPPQQPPPATAPVPSGAAGAAGPEGALPVYGNTSALSKIFNPDIAVIGNFIGAAGTNPNALEPGLQLHEAETSFQAVVDPYARADFFLAFGQEGVEVEEGFITFTSLPGGLLTRVGKMRSAFGKVGTMHNHVLPWSDRPIVINNLAGGEEGISDAGVSVSRLVPNRWVFLEATGQVFRGESAVFSNYQRSDLTYVAHLRGYQDLTESMNVDFGVSGAYGHNDEGPEFTAGLFGIDATFRYRPLRRAIYRRFIGRTELVWSRHGEPTGNERSFGLYASGEYQFARRWFAGVRYDRSARATASEMIDTGGSFLLTYWPSEFSQVRGQYRRTRYGDGVTANEFLFQFMFSIGAHGAHPF